MNRFGQIADELTDLIEELDHLDLVGESGPLKAALQRAFAKACEAERVLRLKTQAAPRPANRQRLERAESPARAGFGVVIELPRAWRPGAAGARRLND